MFKSIGTTLLAGFITLLPIVLMVYLLFWLATTSEQVMGGALQWLLPNILYFPGLGIVAGLALISFLRSKKAWGRLSPSSLTTWK